MIDKELSDRLDKIEAALKRIESMVTDRHNRSGDASERARQIFLELYKPPRFPDIRGKR